MFQFLQVLSLVLVAVGMGLSLAHALEYPGKLRLPKDIYLTVQTIYYPGFTIGGFFGEFGAIVATFVLLVVTPSGDAIFSLTLSAFVALVIMDIVYWVVLQPVNKVWLQKQKMGVAGNTFFATGRGNTLRDADWTSLRTRWEYAHIARAALAMFALIALATAVTT